MAEWGKGDDRWIVQDREDGANVNQWHWSEKDCLPWSQDRFRQLFENCKLVDGDSGVSASVTSVDSVEGEAFLNVRKKKLIPSYELSVKLSFNAEVGGDSVQGKVCTTTWHHGSGALLPKHAASRHVCIVGMAGKRRWVLIYSTAYMIYVII